jgi:hypothetical protein
MGYLDDPINPPRYQHIARYLVLCRQLYRWARRVRDSCRRFKKAATNTDVEGCRHVHDSPYSCTVYSKLSVPSVRMGAATEQFDATLSDWVPARHASCVIKLPNVIVNAISVSSIRDTHSVLYLDLPRSLTVCLFSSAICCRKANPRQNTSPLTSFRMALPRSISCRGLGFRTGWGGNNVTRYSGRMDLQTTKEVRKGSKARLFTSSSSRATLYFAPSSRLSASGLPHDYSRSRTLPASLHNFASLSRLSPRCQNLNTTRQYQNMASEDGEAKKGTTFKVENQTTPAEPSTLPPSTHASSTSKPPIPPPDSSPSSPSPDSIPTNAQQRQTDWRIIKRLMINVWPRNDWKTRLTVLGGFGLLVSAKVRLLNRSVLESSNSFFCRFSMFKSRRFSKQ